MNNNLNDERNQNRPGFRKTIIAVCLVAMPVISILAAIFPDISFYLSVSVCVPAAIAITALIAEPRQASFDDGYLEKLLERAGDIAYIKHDKKAGKAVVSDNIAALTGIAVKSRVIDEREYFSLMTELIASPYHFANNIYMTQIPEKWISVDDFSGADFEGAVIKDVSKLVSYQNIIKSLKYYDAATGALSKEAFINQINQSALDDTDIICLVHFVISGTEKTIFFTNESAVEIIYAKIAMHLNKYANPHNIFIGRTSTNEFSMLFSNYYEEKCRQYASKVHSGLLELLDIMPENAGKHINVYCGYAIFTYSDIPVSDMLGCAEFAAYEALRENKKAPGEYNADDYKTSALNFSKIQVFSEIIRNNLIDYHFQPIVNARTGDIFGYEALMRPRKIGEIGLFPLEFLKIAESQDMLREVERLTFFNTMKILSENREALKDRKLFINSIPGCKLSDADYASFCGRYEDLFGAIVVEIIESGQLISENIAHIKENFKLKGIQIALDDYGSGYANQTTLLNLQPNYIKIDRSIVMDIDKELKKQQLVIGIINFAKQNNITVLAEGVETSEELEMFISFGIDLIQGYFTCKPQPNFVPEIGEEAAALIADYNIKHIGYVDKFYDVVNGSPVDIMQLAFYGYTEIIIRNKEARLVGDADSVVKMRITVPDNTKTDISLIDVNMDGVSYPALTVGLGSDVILRTEGRNRLSPEGIRVPLTSSLSVEGDGYLRVECVRSGGVALGGSFYQDFGEINLNGTGCVDVFSDSPGAVAIGGGNGADGSIINIRSGEIKAHVKGVDIVGIGSNAGEAGINLEDVKIKILGSGQNVTAIGSRNGHVDITSRADLDLECSGDKVCLIGALERSGGSISISGGNSKLRASAKVASAIGGVGGNIKVGINSGTLDILGEGDVITCIGDASGAGQVYIGDAIITAEAKAGKRHTIYVKDGKSVIAGGNLKLTGDEAPLDRIFSPNGLPLKYVAIDKKGGNFKATIPDADGKSYEFSARVSDDEYINAYLPEDYKPARAVDIREEILRKTEEQSV